ncbi:hypothetical protein JTB14_036872 [Gonioctena quinquepunctata]|nr:hypothetical protein JTB14_036872 [Gonioctena quinquepunctata]
MTNCIACNNNSEEHQGFSYFRFPKDEKRCDAWRKNINIPLLDYQSPEECHRKYRVCSAHFDADMFSNVMKNRLKRDAVPTIFHGGRRKKNYEVTLDDETEFERPTDIEFVAVKEEITDFLDEKDCTTAQLIDENVNET